MTLTIDNATLSRSSRHGVLHAEDDNLPAYVYLALFSIAIPMSYYIGDIYMTVSRTILLFLMPVLLVRLLNGAYGGINRVDILFGLFMIWFGIAIVMQGRGNMVTFIGSNYIIILGGYLLGRCGVRGPRSFRQMIIFYGVLVLFSLPFATIEMIDGEMPLARLIDQIPGISGSPDVEYPSRNELERVQFVFTHPIHYGLFCTYIFALVAIGLKHVLPFAVRWIWGLAVIFCCFTAGSSGPFLGIAIAILLMIYDVVSRGRWKLLLWGSLVMYIILDILSDRPAYYAIIERLAFNPGTAFGRRLILEAGVVQMQRTPFFGTQNPLPVPHWMTGSLDNHWLLIGVAHGIPALILLGWAYIHAMVKAGKVDLSHDPEKAALRKAWIIGMVGSAFTLATVAVWNEVETLTYLMLGCGVWFMTTQGAEQKTAEGETPEAASETEEAPGGRPGPVFSRFETRSRRR